MSKIPKSLLPVLSLLFFINSVYAQSTVKFGMIGVNGLTCSACSRTVEMSIRKLDFVKDVEMNLEHTNGKIIFKDNVVIDPGKIAKAITDAGFSVRFIHLIMDFNSVNISDNFCYKSENFTLQFYNTGAQVLKGETTVKLIGEQFLPKPDFKKIKNNLKASCESKNPVYFVTL